MSQLPYSPLRSSWSEFRKLIHAYGGAAARNRDCLVWIAQRRAGEITTGTQTVDTTWCPLGLLLLLSNTMGQSRFQSQSRVKPANEETFMDAINKFNFKLPK